MNEIGKEKWELLESYLKGEIEEDGPSMSPESAEAAIVFIRSVVESEDDDEDICTRIYGFLFDPDSGNVPSERAWKVIRFMQGESVLNDDIERCETCDYLYDSCNGGTCLDWGDSPFHFCGDCIDSTEYKAKIEGGVVERLKAGDADQRAIVDALEGSAWDEVETALESIAEEEPKIKRRGETWSYSCPRCEAYLDPVHDGYSMMGEEIMGKIDHVDGCPWLAAKKVLDKEKECS